MNKKFLLLLCIVVAVVFSGYKGGVFIYGEGQIQSIYTGIYFNILSDDSYDVRDKTNQKIFDEKLEKELKTLFVSCLYTLLLNSEIYSISRAIEFLRQKFDLSLKYFTRSVLIFVQEFFVWFVPQIRKLFCLKHLQFLLSALILLTFLNFISYLFFTPKAKVAPLVLRC
ncbi:MAG: hypothetical protein ACK4JE_04565 [Endomicrobiia bacterium]